MEGEASAIKKDSSPQNWSFPLKRTQSKTKLTIPFWTTNIIKIKHIHHGILTNKDSIIIIAVPTSIKVAKVMPIKPLIAMIIEKVITMPVGKSALKAIAKSKIPAKISINPKNFTKNPPSLSGKTISKRNNFPLGSKRNK